MNGMPCDVMRANCCPAAAAAAIAALKLAAAAADEDGEECGGKTEGWSPAPPSGGKPLPGPCGASEPGFCCSYGGRPPETHILP